MNRFTSVIAPDLTMLSASSQEQLIRKFLPVELIPAGWTCQEGALIKNIQNLYDKSNKTIQMYGSPENFEKALINFMSFPGNQQFFQFNNSVCYRTYVRVYQSLGGVSYIYKKDIYDILHEFAPKIDTLAPLQELGHNLLAYYLKIQQNKLTTSHEMIVYNHEFMQNLEKKRLVNEEGMESESWKRHVSESAFYHSKNDDEVLNTITSLFVKCGATLDSDMRETVTSVMKYLPVKENVLEYTRMIFCLYNTMEGYMELIGKNKLMMLSRCETVESIPISKISIRLFESNEEKMVMSHELLHAIKLENLDVSGFEDKILAMPKLSTMNFREVFGTIPSDIFKMLEFVKVPLKTGPRSLVVVPTIDGNHCVSAYQFFIRTISDMILVRKIFQGMKLDQWPPIMKELFGMLSQNLIDESDFISYESYEEMSSVYEAWLKRSFPVPNRKNISNVNKNGFTAKELEVQLKRLELTEVFPQIEQHAYRMPRNPPTNGCFYEATKLMFKRIQDCQFAYVCIRLTKQLVRIIHERKWCRTLIPDDYCSICVEEKNDELIIKQIQAFGALAENQQVEKEENHPEATTSSSDASSSDEPLELSSTEKSDDLVPEKLSSSSSGKTSEVETQNTVQKPKKTKKKKSEEPAVKPEVKESQACPKCIRASEYTTKTNEKLRMSKIEVKHLKKELSAIELALEEKNERIRILEEKLREKESLLNLKTSEVETLNIEKKKLEQKNKRNERLIATSHEVISKKDMAIESWKYHNFEKDKLIKTLKAKESKAIPPRSAEESEKVDSFLSSLLETKTILTKEDPVKKSSDICDYLISEVDSEVTQQLVKYETKVFQLQVSSYSQLIENNIKLIRGNQHIKMDQLPEIPDFPEFSEEFKSVHKSITKKEAPLLCRQLLKLTDEIADMECVICINDMESHDDTTKCAHCKRRFHNHCIKSWLKKKSICPTCKHGMVDEQEFPAL